MSSDTDRIVELFKQEVPEVASGVIELKVVARKPGVRAKVAVEGTTESWIVLERALAHGETA
jgi:transcription antitermination factor NusA-like protein